MYVDENKIRRDIEYLKRSKEWANAYQKQWYRGAIETLKELLREHSPEQAPPQDNGDVGEGDKGDIIDCPRCNKKGAMKVIYKQWECSKCGECHDAFVTESLERGGRHKKDSSTDKV